MQLCKDCKFVDDSPIEIDDWKCLAPKNMSTNFISGAITPKIIYCANIRNHPHCSWFIDIRSSK